MDRPPLILGLDLGTNSIGWALLETKDGEPSGLAGCGVRIFQEAVDAQKGTPKNKKRRQARQARKLVSRRKMRRAALVNLLAHHDLLPKEPEAKEALLRTLDPYLLRKRGLDEPLTLHEFGRVIFHLNQRRGFQSNRKTALGELAGDAEIAALIQAEEARKAAEAKKKGKASKEEEEDEGVVMAAITELRRAMAETGARTLGEYLHSLPQKRNRYSEQGRYTDRSMYKEEFDALWNAQAPHHPEAFTDDLKVKVHNLIFFQRPLKPQKFLVGKCQFEMGKKRAPWARPEAQRFRCLQDVNHLEVKDPITRMMRPLTPEERGKIAAKLEEQEEMKWGGVRKLLKLHKGEQFNLEEGGKDKLIGNRTSIKLRKALPDCWDGLPPERQEAFVEDLLSIRKKEVLLKRLRGHWGLSAEQAYAVLTTELQPGYASLSLKAIHKILPHLEKGLNYHDACQAAGYKRADQKEAKSLDRLPLPPRLRNPVVQKCLHEVRKVVNAVIRKWGKPDLIRVELAREMKLTKKQKESLDRQNRQNRKLNDEAREKLKELGVADTGEARLKYRLWKECGGTCPYSGQGIGMEMLFTQDAEIDHILPYSRTLDDSYMNKTICLTRANRDKGDRTPHEAWCGDAGKYAELLQRVAKMGLPWAKRRRFEQKEIKTEELIERKLNDTRYASVEAKNYLQQLGVRVHVSKGEATAAIRRSWDLNRILSPDASEEKNRADHRHHTIDAIVVALTDHHLFQRAARHSLISRLTLGNPRFKLPFPWEGFRGQAEEQIRAIVVSHAPARKIAGALHEETAYGEGLLDGEKVYVHRVRLESLTPAQVKRIRDAKIRRLVEERLAQHDGNAKKAFAEPLYLEHTRKGGGQTRIAGVRIAEKMSPGSLQPISKGQDRAYKFHPFGNNHHVEIIENVKTGKREGRFITTMEAARRARRTKEPVVQRDHGPEWKFVMSLTENDMVEIENDGAEDFFRVQKMSGPDNSVEFRFHTAATLDDANTHKKLRPNSPQFRHIRKLNVDPLGNVTFLLKGL